MDDALNRIGTGLDPTELELLIVRTKDRETKRQSRHLDIIDADTINADIIDVDIIGEEIIDADTIGA